MKTKLSRTTTSTGVGCLDSTFIANTIANIASNTEAAPSGINNLSLILVAVI